MATKIGPKTVTQRDRSKALVFCVDAAHSDSYGGEPTTNSVQNPEFSGGATTNWNKDGDVVWSTIADNNNPVNSPYIIKITDGANVWQNLGSASSGMGTVKQGQSYSFSCYMKGEGTVKIASWDNNSGTKTLASYITLTNNWQLVQMTQSYNGSHLTTDMRFYICSQLGGGGGTSSPVLYVCGPQTEQSDSGGGGYATPFVNGSRVSGLYTEKAVDGAFSDTANWTEEGGMSVTGGQAVASSAVADRQIYQAGSGFIRGRTYKATLTCNGFTSGSVAVRFDGTDGNLLTGTGTSTATVVCTTETPQLGVVCRAGSNTLTCSDISVVEVGTNAVRNISGVGAVNTAITGTFATYGNKLYKPTSRRVLASQDVNQGHIGGAYWDLDGSDEYISFGDVALNLSTGATMAFWCEHADNTNGAVLGSDDNGYHSYIQPHENGNIYFESSDDSNTAYGAMSGTTGFHHYVVSVTGYTATIYENGVAITTDGSLSSANVTFNYIGTTGAKWFNGKVASVMMWSAALTAKEVKDIYIAQKGRFGK